MTRQVQQKAIQNSGQRREAVLALFSAGQSPSEIARTLNSQGVRNPRTKQPYSRTTVINDLKTLKQPSITKTPLSETIGQWTYVKPQWNARVLLNVDTTWKDYIFWDALRRGTAPGYEISGPAFCLPAAQTIASYAFGKGIKASLIESAIPSDQSRTTLHEAALSEANGRPTQNKQNANKQNSKPTLNKATGGQKQPLAMVQPKAKPNPNATEPLAWTNLQLQNFLKRVQSFLLSTTVDEYCLGNQYVFINPDCTLSVASPETVTVEYSASDYRRVERVIVRTKMQQAKVEDTYTAEKRTLYVQYYDDRPNELHEYENLIGRIPCVHFANDRSANEIYGRPIYEAGLPIMWRYDNLIKNILEGVTLLGTPIPTFTGLENPSETKLLNSDAVTYTDDDGNQQTQYITRLDRQSGLYIGKGGDAKMLSTPVGFTKDSIDSLRELKLLWLNETHIPEFMLGGAIASSKASTETQMPPFIQYINFRRLMLEGQAADPALGIDAHGGLLELIDIWLRTYKLLNPAIVVGPVQIDWPEIDLANDQVKYLWGTYLSGTGKIDDTAVVKMSGYFADPQAEVMKAAGKKPRPPQFDDYESKLRQARLDALRSTLEPPNDDGKPFSTDYTVPDIDLLKDGEHQHASGAAMGGNEWNPFGPLFWIGELSGRGG